MCLSDVDEDGVASSNTDGVYIFRGLLGLETIVPPLFRMLDPTIIADADILQNIALGVGSGFDVDGDGIVLPNTDGIYIGRALRSIELIVPPLFRMLDPTIPADAVISDAVMDLCPPAP